MERFYFFEEYDERQELILNEGQDMRWVSFEELWKLDLTSQVSDAKEQLRWLLAEN